MKKLQETEKRGEKEKEWGEGRKESKKEHKKGNMWSKEGIKINLLSEVIIRLK